MEEGNRNTFFYISKNIPEGRPIGDYVNKMTQAVQNPSIYILNFSKTRFRVHLFGFSSRNRNIWGGASEKEKWGGL
jgi:hypothetical protein